MKTLPIDEKEESFWDLLMQTSCILQPIAEAITKLGDMAKIDKVYLIFKNLRSQINFALSNVAILDDDQKETIKYKEY